jgi:hypothetical protein
VSQNGSCYFQEWPSCTTAPQISQPQFSHPHAAPLSCIHARAHRQRARCGNARAVKELAWGKRLDMLKDVAAGMHYLHTRKPHAVIHGDLRSPNLLLDLTIDIVRPRFHVKIADVSVKITGWMLFRAGGVGVRDTVLVLSLGH